MELKNLLRISLFTLLLFSCGKDDGATPSDNNPNTTISLDMESLELYRGEDAQIQASLSGADGTIVWSSSDESVATVNQSGQILAVDKGFATITASFGGINTSLDLNVMPNTYVAGYMDNDNEIARAVFWKNGTPVFLTDGSQNSYGLSMFVDGNDEYVVGSEFNGSYDVAMLWKNGEPHPLSDGSTSVYPSSIVVDNSITYIAGTDFNGPYYIAKLWTNGVATDLSDGPFDSFANSVFLERENIYVVGYEFNGAKYVAKLWKNGVEEDITDGTNNATAKAVFVKDEDTYVVGDEFINGSTIAMLWKNGVAHPLTDGAYYATASSVFVKDTDVYVTGYENDGSKNAATIWKNGETITLPSDSMQHTYGFSVFVDGNDVVVAGFNQPGGGEVGYMASLWKNGESHPDLQIEKTVNSGAYSVFVH